MTQIPPPATFPPQAPPQIIYQVAPPKKSKFWRVVLTLLFLGSIGLNLVLILAIGMLGAGRAGQTMSPTVLEKGAGEDIVAVYQVSGVIADNAAAEFYRFYQTVRDNERIKAVVLRVDSGGGGVSASDQIHQCVLAIRNDLKKPVVVSMGGVAASGAYYLSAPADEIWAEPTTITGSIGVIAAWPVMKGLMDKVGVEPVIIRSRHAEQWKARENFMESPDALVRKDVQDMLDAMQARFEDIVRKGRGTKLHEAPEAEAPKPAAPAGAAATTAPAAPGPAPFNGRTYLADEAKKLGLIDNVGYFQDACKAAARLAGLGNPKIVRYARRTGLAEVLFSGEDPEAARPGIHLDAETLDNLTAPRILMVWKP